MNISLPSHLQFSLIFACKISLNLFITMTYLHISMVLLLSRLIPAANSATTDTLSASRALSISDKLVSKNGRYALGFFKVGNNSSQKH